VPLQGKKAEGKKAEGYEQGETGWFPPVTPLPAKSKPSASQRSHSLLHVPKKDKPRLRGVLFTGKEGNEREPGGSLLFVTYRRGPNGT